MHVGTREIVYDPQQIDKSFYYPKMDHLLLAWSATNIHRYKSAIKYSLFFIFSGFFNAFLFIPQNTWLPPESKNLKHTMDKTNILAQETKSNRFRDWLKGIQAYFQLSLSLCESTKPSMDFPHKFPLFIPFFHDIMILKSLVAEKELLFMCSHGMQVVKEAPLHDVFMQQLVVWLSIGLWDSHLDLVWPGYQ